MALTVEEIVEDYRGRRTAIIRALTEEVDQFYKLCDPEEDKLCLYGFPNEDWKVSLPPEKVPGVLPDPAERGINLARNDLNREDWLCQVALRSDSWLIYMAFYHGAFLKNDERTRLFSLINGIPTVSEDVANMEPIENEDNDTQSDEEGQTID